MANGIQNIDGYFNNIKCGREEFEYQTSDGAYNPTIHAITFSSPFGDNNYDVFIQIAGGYTDWTTISITTSSITANGFNIVVFNNTGSITTLNSAFFWLAVHR